MAASRSARDLYLFTTVEKGRVQEKHIHKERKEKSNRRSSSAFQFDPHHIMTLEHYGSDGVIVVSLFVFAVISIAAAI